VLARGRGVEQGNRDAFAAIAKAAHEHGMPFEGHVPDAVSLFDAAAAGQHTFEHLTGLVQVCQATDSPYIGVGTIGLQDRTAGVEASRRRQDRGGGASVPRRPACGRARRSS